MVASLVGKRVQVIIEEDGNEESPRLPPGTIERRLAGPDRDDYFLIQLDAPVECVRASTGARWVLSNLIVAAVLVGDSLEDLFVPQGEELVLVAIRNVIMPLDPKGGRFDFSQVVNFARGRAVRV